MNAPLDQLYRLQDRIRFVRARERDRDTIPGELVEVDREYRAKVEAVDRLKNRRAEAEIERRRAHAELSEHREKLRKYQTQLRAVQNSREYGAVLNEIDGVEKLVRGMEDRISSLDEEIQSATKELAGREEMLPLETEQHEERLKGWRTEQRAINEELASAQEEIGKLEASMHPRDRSEFHRLLDKKGGLAIVLVAGNSCSACHVKVRPAALQSLKAGREIVYCDSCKRILYWDMQRSRRRLSAFGIERRSERFLDFGFPIPDFRSMKFRAFIDGAARGNPGPAGAGVFVEPEHGRPALEFYEPLGSTTNNVAEYRALLLALERAEYAGADEVEIRSDSRLLVEQLRGNFKIRAEHLKPLLAESIIRAKRFRSFSISYIPRDQNGKADRLANKGADASERSTRF